MPVLKCAIYINSDESLQLRCELCIQVLEKEPGLVPTAPSRVLKERPRIFLKSKIEYILLSPSRIF